MSAGKRALGIIMEVIGVILIIPGSAMAFFGFMVLFYPGGFITGFLLLLPMIAACLLTTFGERIRRAGPHKAFYKKMRCQKCGFNMDASLLVCPKCGEPAGHLDY